MLRLVCHLYYDNEVMFAVARILLEDIWALLKVKCVSAPYLRSIKLRFLCHMHYSNEVTFAVAELGST